MNISLFGKVSQESLGITKPRHRKGGRVTKLGPAKKNQGSTARGLNESR